MWLKIPADEVSSPSINATALASPSAFDATVYRPETRG